MELLPAIDLMDGCAVRLVQGDFGRKKVYGDPLELAISFKEQGANWIHVVDLDAARTGKPQNRTIVQEIAKIADIRVQTGGGVRTLSDVDELLSSGVTRVVLGTAALEEGGFVEQCTKRWPESIALGLDYKENDNGELELATRGWLQGSGRLLTQMVTELSDMNPAAFVVTAIKQDGTLDGPDIDGLSAVLNHTKLKVIASGGVGSKSDLDKLSRVSVDGKRLGGVIVGKALVEGRFTIKEAVAACVTHD